MAKRIGRLTTSPDLKPQVGHSRAHGTDARSIERSGCWRQLKCGDQTLEVVILEKSAGNTEGDDAIAPKKTEI